MKRLLSSALGALLLSTVPALADELPPSDGGLHLIVRGSIDHDAIRSGIERELGTPVTEVLGMCDVPCVDIGIEDNTATVLFSPRHGAARMRTVPLGADTSQWPVLITLLAGNLVRDEAASLLADLPGESQALPAVGADIEIPAAPAVTAGPELVLEPAHAPVPAPAAITPAMPAPAWWAKDREARERRPFALGLVPGASTDLGNIGTIRHGLSINAIVGVGGGSEVAAISGVVDIQRGRVHGVQVAGVSVFAPSVAGMQIGGAAAVAGDLHGVQLAGAAAVSDRSSGLQIGGAVAVARRAAEIQIGGAVAVSQGAADFQLGGATSVARVANVQIAGAVNVAEEVRGVQLAPINVARRVEGVQIGVVNIGGSADGFSFGLVNIIPGGRTDLEASVDSDATGALLLRHGSRRWHNVYGIAGNNTEETGPRNDDVWMYGLGFGPTWTRGSTVVDLEAMSWHVHHGKRFTTDLSQLSQLRLSVAHDLGPVSLVAGGALNVLVTNDDDNPLLLARRTPGDVMDTGVKVEIWPTAFIGARM